MSVEINKATQQLIQACLTQLPQVQAIYLFGSWGTDDENSSSDIDIALLLPVQDARKMMTLYASDLHKELERLFSKNIDLINLRQVSTVLQKEIIAENRRIYCADDYAADEFEMLTMSYYQKLNDERAEVLQEFFNSKRAYNI